MSNLNEPTKDFQLRKLFNQSIQWCTFYINDKDINTYKSKKICGDKARIISAV